MLRLNSIMQYLDGSVEKSIRNLAWYSGDVLHQRLTQSHQHMDEWKLMAR